MEFKPVPTRASLCKKQNVNFEAIVFEEPKYSNKQQTNKPPKNAYDEEIPKQRNKPSTTTTDDGEFDIKKARHEVLKFAMNNQRVIKNKKKMEIFQAVKLGAKAPRKKCKNYKELLDERKRLKDIREERRKFHQLGKNQTGAASVKCRSKPVKKRAPVSSIDQHYGKVRPRFKKN